MITNYPEICCLCNRKAEHTHHLVFGVSNRNISDAENLTMPVCELCHRKIHEGEKAKSGNRDLDLFNRYAVMSKIIGQLEYEKKYVINKAEIPFWDAEEEARESFRHIFGKSFI